MLERRMVHLGELATEQRNPRSAHIDTAGTAELLSIINKDDQGVAPAVEAAIGQIAPLLDHLTAQVRAGGRLFYIGAGTSGRLGVLDASECPPTFGVSPEMVQGIMAGGMEALYRATEATEDDPASGAADLETRGFRAGDVLVGIAASGRTPYVIGAVRAARAMGAVTAAVVCAEGSALGGEVDYPIAVPVGPEVADRQLEQLAGRVTIQLLGRGIGLDDAAVLRHQQDRVARMLHQGAGVAQHRLAMAAGAIQFAKSMTMTHGSILDRNSFVR